MIFERSEKMTFGEVWRKGLRNGKKVKRSEWGGYWVWDDQKKTIMMYCKDGRVIDVRDTNNVRFTFDNISANDWKIAEEEETVYTKDEVLAALNFGSMFISGVENVAYALGIDKEEYEGRCNED
jgi:hypothetical protein